MGLVAQAGEVADEAAADAYREVEREDEGGEAEDPGGGGADEDADGDGPDALLVAVGGGAAAFGEPVEDLARGRVPALGGDAVRRPGRGGGDRGLQVAQGAVSAPCQYRS